MKLKNKMLSLALLAALALTTTSCHKEEKPKSVLTDVQMQSIMMDLYLFEGSATVKQLPIGDMSKVPYYSAILKKHNVSLAQFDSSMVWYAKHTKEFKELHKVVVDSLEARKSALDATKK